MECIASLARDWQHPRCSFVHGSIFAPHSSSSTEIRYRNDLPHQFLQLVSTASMCNVRVCMRWEMVVSHRAELQTFGGLFALASTRQVRDASNRAIVPYSESIGREGDTFHFQWKAFSPPILGAQVVVSVKFASRASNRFATTASATLAVYSRWASKL